MAMAMATTRNPVPAGSEEPRMTGCGCRDKAREKQWRSSINVAPMTRFSKRAYEHI